LEEPETSTPKIEPAEAINHIVSWIRDYFEPFKDKKAVIGISGGKDSTVCAMLLVKALGKDRVVAVKMPKGQQPDIDDSEMVCKCLGITNYTVNIKAAVDGMIEGLKAAGVEPTKDTLTNIDPRVRMTTLYAVAQSLPNGGLVTNTCNLSENYVGYSTKFGDHAGDFSILHAFAVREVIEMGLILCKEFGVPETLIRKAPSDGLCGKTDEDNLGFTYAALDSYILDGEEPEDEILDKIQRKYRANLHKLTEMPHPYPERAKAAVFK
jgi:NAD+ synthase